MPNPILADLEALWPGLTDQEREALLKAAQRFVRDRTASQACSACWAGGCYSRLTAETGQCPNCKRPRLS